MHRPQSHHDLQSLFERGELMIIICEEDRASFLDELLFMCIRYNPDVSIDLKNHLTRKRKR
ncbi:hypothetical protein OESDEN_17694 [Oesophagostomum dentatum]|uniref:Uncharacterized protein n=1 Tax=Oesophagostomum dentatum TaxID=61180 RepID=A0A0B1SGH7_OESDE|nr:hypothetical protein OESDEN_17694 [Oesophagostomum dentatum]